MYRRTSLVSGINSHARPTIQHDYEATTVTPSGNHLTQSHAFSLGEAPTTTPLRAYPPSPSSSNNTELPPGTTTMEYSRDLRSDYRWGTSHNDNNQSSVSNALPAHVRSYVQELRRKKQDFDERRLNLIRQETSAATTTSFAPIRAPSAVPIPSFQTNNRRAVAKRRAEKRSVTNPSGVAQSLVEQLKNTDVLLRNKTRTIEHVERALQESDATILKLQLRVNEVENRRATLERQTSIFLDEKETKISTMYKQMDVMVRENRERRQEHDVAINALRAKNDALSVQLLALKSSPMAAASPNSWTRTALDVAASNNTVVTQDDQTELVVQMKLAVEALELRNYELRQELALSASAAVSGSTSDKELLRAMEIMQEKIEAMNSENVELKRKHRTLEMHQIKLLEAARQDSFTIKRLTGQVLGQERQRG